MVLLCIAWLIPTFGLFVTSFRSASDANNDGWWNAIKSPLSLTLENYRNVLTTGSNPMGNAFVNSLAVAIPATIIPILIACFAAYAFTFMEFKGRDWLFILIVGLLVVPNQVALVPLSILFTKWGIGGQFLTVWLAHTGFGMPLAVYILRNYMATLPMSLIESAKIDGASHWKIFWRLIMPLSVPALASFAIFQFLWVWNDLLVALVFLGQGKNIVMTVALASLMGTQGQGWELLTAAAFLTMVLPITVFLVLQRFFIRGMTSGAVKG
ncbi:sugar ABC transporter permease [Arsenicicoccus sp. oral taxon 190]|nr:sugar ABC transporter permease [Arsenicicoccus sp. oral taxon 190]